MLTSWASDRSPPSGLLVVRPFWVPRLTPRRAFLSRPSGDDIRRVASLVRQAAESQRFFWTRRALRNAATARCSSPLRGSSARAAASTPTRCLGCWTSVTSYPASSISRRYETLRRSASRRSTCGEGDCTSSRSSFSRYADEILAGSATDLSVAPRSSLTRRSSPPSVTCRWSGMPVGAYKKTGIDTAKGAHTLKITMFTPVDNPNRSCSTAPPVRAFTMTALPEQGSTPRCPAGRARRQPGSRRPTTSRPGQVRPPPDAERRIHPR